MTRTCLDCRHSGRVALSHGLSDPWRIRATWLRCYAPDADPEGVEIPVGESVEAEAERLARGCTHWEDRREAALRASKGRWW